MIAIIGKWLIGEGLKYVIIALVAGIGWWQLTEGAYNRGVAATVQKMQVLIDKGTTKVKEDVDGLKNVPEDKLDETLRKLCEAHKKPEQKCGP